MPINLVIPAAGLGSRFRAVGIDTPKPLIPILGIPMIGWVMGNFDLNKDDNIFIISRKEDALPSVISDFLRNIENQIEFIEIDHLTDGAATTLEFALRNIENDNPVLCVNSDQFVSSELATFMDEVRFGSSSGQILTMKADGNKWSYVERDNNGKVVRVIEKVQISDEATVGIYGWRTSQLALDSIGAMKSVNFRVNGEYYVAPSYTFLASDGERIVTTNIGDVETAVHGLGTPEDLEVFLKNLNLETYASQVKQRLGIALNE